MAKNKKTNTDKNLEEGLGDLAKLVLGKLDEHGVTMEQALSAITAAGEGSAANKAPAKKAPAKKAAAKKSDDKNSSEKE